MCEIGSLFGRDVDLSSDGNTLAVGVAQFDGIDEDRGYVQVYQFVNGSWRHVGGRIHGEVTEEYFGRRLALSGDASTLAIRGTGLVRLFRRENDEWLEILEQTSETLYYNAAGLSKDGTVFMTGGRVFDVNVGACESNPGG